MSNPEEAPPLPDFINQSALETQGNDTKRLIHDQYKNDDEEDGDDWRPVGGDPPPLFLNITTEDVDVTL